MKTLPWRYVLHSNFCLRSQHLDGIEFSNHWLSIADGVLVIRAGYAWDGCSPKFSVPLFGLFHFGVPDGPWHRGVTPTYYASLVHDALCQFAHLIPITRVASIALFDDLLAASGWRYRRLYVLGVRLFGPRRFAGDARR